MKTTNNKPMSDVMQANQGLLPLIMNNVPQAVFWKDRNLVYLGCNQTFADDAGFSSPEDVIGKTDFDMPWKAQAEFYRADDLRVIETNESKLHYEEPQTTADGSTIWLSTSKIPVHENGQVVAVLGMYEDVTAHKQAENAIHESEERFRRFAEATVEGLVFHEQGTIIDANPAVLAMFGVPDKEKFLGRDMLEFIVPESHKLVMQQMQSDTVLSYEIQCARYDGTIFPVETSTRTYKVGDHTIRASSIRDITERKESVRAIQENEQRFRALFESANDVIFTLRADKIIDVNSKTLEIFKLESRDKIIGHAVSEFSPEFQPDGVSSVQKAGEKINLALRGEPQIFEWKHIQGDGTSFDAEISLNRLEIGGETLVQAMIRDITERKQAETEVQKSQQLLQSFLNNFPDGAWAKDLEGHFLIANRYLVENIYGTTHDQVIGKTVYDTFPKDVADFIWTSEKRLLETGEGIVVEENIPQADGQVYNKITTKFPLYDADGNINGVGGVLIDITERKRLEAQAQQAFERRGYQVQVSTDISQEVAAATELSELFERVVTLTKERLGYYHTQLLRYDPAQDAVLLINGYGETGQKMLDAGHRMPMGSGLIGTAASTGETVMRSTLAEDPDWQPNPLLPETKGEIAVPIKWQDNVLGVLDVQSNQAGALAEDDRLLLEGLCGQIAIAMHSAELVEAVRQNEARLAEALRAARLANWEYDVEKDIFTFNDHFYLIFRTTAERVGGYKISSADYSKNFVHPDDASLVGSEIQKALDAKDRLFTTHLEHRIIFSDGEVGYIAVNINVERDENGKITRWYGANQDITERKLAEEALRINEARLAEALKIARLAHWEYDAEKALFILNDQFYSILHTTAEKAGGYQLSPARYVELFVYPDDRELVGTEIGKALNSTERVYNTSIDHRTLYADGVVGFMTVNLTVERDENGKITRDYGTNQDITEQRKVQEEMAERLEEINRLYRNMSHEGWKTYRETAELPAGFMFDQTGTRPVEEVALADENLTSVPMKVLGGEVVGTLAVASDPRNPTSTEDIAFIQKVSDQIALALEGARLTAQTQAALAQSERLFEASRTLTQSADLQELVAAVVTTLNIPAANRALLTTFQYGPSGDIEQLTIIGNWWNGSGHEVTPIGTQYPREVMRVMPMFISPTPVFFNDVFNDERVDATTLELIAKRLNLRSVAVLPLYSANKQIGALVLEGEEPHKFSQQEIRLFSSLAPQIATILENRQQYEQAQHQAEREAMLNVINQKIQSATSVEAVLQIAARELGHALGAPMTIAQLSMKGSSS